jgi:hypothetical protein
MSLDDETATKIAELANVPPDYRDYFRALIDRAFRGAERAGSARPQRTSSTDIIDHLRDIGKAARSLEKRLGGNFHARQFLEADLLERNAQLETYLESLKTLQGAVAASIADVKATLGRRGRPGGIKTPFDVFIFQLLNAARTAGGKLTIYKAYKSGSSDRWSGSALDVVKLIRPKVPASIMPKSNLGFAIDRINKILNKVHPQ